MQQCMRNLPMKIIFRNVSSLSITEISFPFEISGFEVIDNSRREWENRARYTVHDFEDGKISFYCEQIEVDVAGSNS